MSYFILIFRSQTRMYSIWIRGSSWQIHTELVESSKSNLWIANTL